jgi:acetoin utilization protein AcuB
MVDKMHILVESWMSRPVEVVAPDILVSDAYDFMTRKAFRRLPVVDNERLVGIVTLGDLREARPSSSMSVSIYELNYLISKLTVGDVMTHNPFTVTANTPIQEAIQVMLERKISGLPVVDDEERVVGIITESDIFEMLIAHWDQFTK